MKRILPPSMLLIVALAALALLTPSGQADAGLPPRPTASPTPTPEISPSPQMNGRIVLSLETPVMQWARLWTAVEWQDAVGGWHTVEGWQGTFNEQGQVIWWVAEKDLGTGPFRWVVYEERYGALWAASESFDLPSHLGETTSVSIGLDS